LGYSNKQIKQINMGFAGTKRNEYTKDKVRNMRSERKTKKAKVAGVSDKDFQYYLGDLIGAGHLKLEGFRKMETDIANDITPLGNALGMGNNVVMRHNIEFQCYSRCPLCVTSGKYFVS